MHETLLDLLNAQSRLAETVSVIRTTSDREEVTFAELKNRAARRLTVLRDSGFQKGDSCVFYIYDEMAFLELFWACMMGGIVPVPIAPGNMADHKNKLLTVAQQMPTARIVADAGAEMRLREYLQSIGRAPDELFSRTLIHNALEGHEDPASPVECSSGDVAFIQFSSGSTRTPKGVVLTHHNLLENLADVSVGFGLTGKSIALSWMPLTHDMGLIGYHLAPLYGGISHHIMRTSLFTRRPLAWLDLASELKVTSLSSPNFGYRHWLKAFRRSESALPDLSNVRIIVNGAEPISTMLIDDFMETLAPAGLAAGAMCTAYGLAEASLLVTASKPGAGLRVVNVDRARLIFGEDVQVVEPSHPNSVVFALDGPCVEHCNLRIGTEDGVELGSGVLGEIQISGGNVTTGYLNQPAENADLFTGDGWLRTGDLGFLHEGELVVTGRLKDMIVFQGLNYFAPDIEMLIEQHGLADTGEVAAGAVTGREEEGFVLFLRSRDIGPGFAGHATAARKLVFENTGLNLVDVVPVRMIPKTTSGKIRRSALVNSFVSGEFDKNMAMVSPEKTVKPKEKPAPENVILEKLRSLMSEDSLDASSLNPRSNFFEIGVTSLLLAELTDELNEIFPDVIEVTDFFEHASVKDVASEIERRLLSVSDR